MGLLIITEADRRRLGIAGVQARFEPQAGRKGPPAQRLPFSDGDSRSVGESSFVQIRNSAKRHWPGLTGSCLDKRGTQKASGKPTQPTYKGQVTEVVSATLTQWSVQGLKYTFTRYTRGTAVWRQDGGMRNACAGAGLYSGSY